MHHLKNVLTSLSKRISIIFKKEQTRRMSNKISSNILNLANKIDTALNRKVAKWPEEGKEPFDTLRIIGETEILICRQTVSQ